MRQAELRTAVRAMLDERAAEYARWRDAIGEASDHMGVGLALHRMLVAGHALRVLWAAWCCRCERQATDPGPPPLESWEGYSASAIADLDPEAPTVAGILEDLYRAEE
jgi:hypothetical protein